MRFRLGRIGIVADVQQAFLSILIATEDRDLLRFLWFRSITDDDPTIMTLRFTRPLFGLRSSPFLFSGTVTVHVSKSIEAGTDVKVLEQLLRDLYVDDVTVSVDSYDEGATFYYKTKSCLKEGGFKLRKWATNDQSLRILIENNEEDKVLSTDDVTYAKDALGNDSPKGYKKVLGINWDNDKDELVFEVSKFGIVGLKRKCTKRNILKISASYFDPLGVICPIILQAVI